MSENAVLDKSQKFALRMVRLYKHLVDERNEYILSKQALLSGIYIGAHVKSAQEAESGLIFSNEMSVALRKASVTEYWLQLLYDSGFLDEKAFNSIQQDCLELLKLLTAITKSLSRSK